MDPLAVALLVVVWLLVGALSGLRRARHGGWAKSWVLLSLLGPFALRAASPGDGEPPPTIELRPGHTRRGAVDVLVGLDGSPDAAGAADLVVALLGPRLRRLTLATVLDLDTARPHDADPLGSAPWPEETAAREHLTAVADQIQRASGISAGAVVLAGAPAKALADHAADDGYELVVTGCRGRGLSTRLLGSCASTLAASTRVPVLLVPSSARQSPSTENAAPSA